MRYYRNDKNETFGIDEEVFIDTPVYGNTEILDSKGLPTGKYKQIGVSNRSAEVIGNIEKTLSTKLIPITVAQYKTLMEPTLAEDIASKLLIIKSEYNKANEFDIAYMSTIFQADKDSQVLITGILAGGAVPVGFTWRDNTNPTNVDVPMTFAEFQGLSQAIVARGQTNWIKYQALKVKVLNAKSKAKLALLVWK